MAGSERFAAQPKLSNDILFRVHELRSMSNARLAGLENDRQAHRKRATYWTGKAVHEFGRASFIAAILVDEGWSREEAGRAVWGSRA